MKLLVCIKQVPADNHVEVDPETGVLKRDGIAGKMNPYDLYALEMALQLKDKHGASVDVLSMGPPQAKATLYEALCIGADQAILLSDRRFAGADVLATARTLVSGIQSLGQYDLIFCGKQTTDGDTAQVGPEMAELLGINHACYVKQLQLTPKAVTASLQMENAVLVQELPIPCLITVEKDANAPRLPSYRRSLEISGDEIQMLTLDDFSNQSEQYYGLSGSPTQVERIFPPPKRNEREMVIGTGAEVAERALQVLVERKFI